MEMPAEAALLVIDVQQGMEDPSWGPRNNLDMEANTSRLIVEWQRTGRPIILVRHDSTKTDSPLRPELPGNAFKPIVSGDPDLLVTKSVNSAFYGDPDLHAWLQAREIDTVVVCGIQTNMCCETTARMAGNLGYATYFVLDATHTFDLVGPDGVTISADELARVTAANLHGEFATVVATDDLVAG
ncbi:MAG: cysteine hydrolase family protein [Acidimicrobiia bacterium]|jgi:nicotinamidase-related amidase